MNRFQHVGILMALGSSLPLVSDGALSIVIQEVGPNVEMTASGSVNLTALGAPAAPDDYLNYILPDQADLRIGPSASGDAYSSLNGPSNYGSGFFGFPTSSTGDFIALTAPSLGNQLIVPQGYVSGSPLNATSTFENTSLVALGIVQGTYEWTWGSGSDADSVTLTVVPEPSTFALLLAFVTAGFVIYRRR